jgi:hypothetical protein
MNLTISIKDVNNAPIQTNLPWIVARLEEGELYFWDAYYHYTDAIHAMFQLHTKGFTSVLIYNKN